MLKIIRCFLLIGIVAYLNGCNTVNGNFDPRYEAERIKGYRYYAKQDPQKEKIELPITIETIRKMTLFEKTISYRNNKKACIEFELPEHFVENLNSIEMMLEAYNDDSQYLRAIWFEVDGVGGYIGTHRVAASQVRGDATIGPKQQKKWVFDLSNCTIASKNTGKQKVDFFKILKKPGRHTVACWLSTYEQYGPHSWVSVALVLK